MLLPLDMLRRGERAEVSEVCGDPQMVRRMAEMGIRTGCRIEMIQNGSPCLLEVGGCRLCLRADSLAQVMVSPVDD